MSTRYNLHDIGIGMKLLRNGEPCIVVAADYVNPGRYQAFNRLKLRHLRSGRMLEHTLHGSDTMEAADVVDIEVEYLYRDDRFWHFMDPRTCEQYAADAEAMAAALPWLKGNEACTLTMWNDVPLLVTPPPLVELKVIATDPGIRGDTSSGGNKPATLETGTVVRVPLFVGTDEVIRVDTRSGEYVSRVRQGTRA